MIIAIDGPSGSGKGTLSRKLAEHYDLAFLDTGILYRAVAALAMEHNVKSNQISKILEIAKNMDVQAIPPQKLKAEGIALMASEVAVIPELRSFLLEFQRSFAAFPPDEKRGAVLDGRDIGTIVCPEANFKFFLTSAVEVRADRRHKELLNLGIKSIYSEVLSDMISRDKRDSERKDSPLRPAKDAHVIDSSEKSIEEVLSFAIHIIDEEKGKRRK